MEVADPSNNSPAESPKKPSVAGPLSPAASELRPTLGSDQSNMKDKGPTMLAARTLSSPGRSDDFDFDYQEEDRVRERFEVLGIQMDLHKNGVLYLKELADMLSLLPEFCKGPVGEFLVAYMKQTRKISITLPLFVSNAMKAHSAGKFRLQEMTAHNVKGGDLQMSEDEIASLETSVKKRSAERKRAVVVSALTQKNRKAGAVEPPSTERIKSPTNARKQVQSSKFRSPVPSPRRPVRGSQKSSRKDLLGVAGKSDKKPVSKPKLAQTAHMSSGKYAKIAKIRSENRAAPKSSYERPTQACLLRHRLNQFISKEIAVTAERGKRSPRSTSPMNIDRSPPSSQLSQRPEPVPVPIVKVASQQPTPKHSAKELLWPPPLPPGSKPFPMSPPASFHLALETGTQEASEEKHQANSASPSPREAKVWPAIIIPPSRDEPAESAKPWAIVPLRSMGPPPDSGKLSPQLSPNHGGESRHRKKHLGKPFGRSDSISEDVEFAYEEEVDKEPRRRKASFISLSPSDSLLGGQAPEKEERGPRQRQNKKKPYLRASSFDSGPRTSTRRKSVRSQFLAQKEAQQHADEPKLQLQIPTDESALQFNPKEAERSQTLVLALEDLQSISRALPQQNIYHDINSQKKLRCVLRNGYSYKFREKKQYNKTGKKPAFSHVAAMVKAQNQLTDSSNTMLLRPEVSTLKPGGAQSPRLGFNESMVQRQESSTSLDSTRQIYNEMFDEKSASGAAAAEEPAASRFAPPKVEVKLNTVRTTTMYKELNMDPGLRDVFSGFNYKDLMGIKKLHLLYAHQKGKAHPQPQGFDTLLHQRQLYKIP